jgi:hypothetical protein
MSLRSCLATIVIVVVTVSGVSQPPPPKPPEPSEPGDPLTAKLGSPEHKAVTAIFETWNSSHTRARAAIRMQTDGFRNRKQQTPPVVHYAAALVMMQIGAYAAPDVESVHLAKLGDHPLVSLAKARIALREEDDALAEKLASDVAADKRIGKLGQAMKEAAVAVGAPDAVDPTVKTKGKGKAKKAPTRSQVAELVVNLIADAKAKSDADLEDERSEMRLLDARYKESGPELVRLRNELDLIQSRTVGVDALGFRGYYLNGFEKSADFLRVQQRIRVVEDERRRAEVRHAALKKYEANELAKLTWRIWSARLPWNVEEERKRILAGKSPAEYYDSNWEYKPSVPTDFPKQIPQPYKAKRKSK